MTTDNSNIFLFVFFSLFEEAAEKLNLQGLLTFLAELGESSRLQLRKLRNIESEGVGSWSRLPTNALHLYRLQEVLMKIAHSSRPLLHLIRVWSVVSPYLVEVTGRKEGNLLFNDALNTFYLRLYGIRHMVKDHSDS